MLHPNKTLLSLISLGLLSSLAQAKLAVKAPKYSIVSDTNTVVKSDSLDVSSAAAALVTLTVGSTETLRLSFNVVDIRDESSLEEGEEREKGVQPHQTFLRFYEDGVVEGIQPVKVAPNGRGKFELNVRRPPSGIPATLPNQILNVDLILGSYTYESTVIPLLKLKLPASIPNDPHPEESMYHPRPAIYHKFKAEQRMPRKEISIVFVGVALGPWVLLFVLLSKLPIHFAPSTATAPFLGLLIAFESLIVWYWVDLKIGQVLTYGAVLAVVTAAAGKRALSTI